MSKPTSRNIHSTLLLLVVAALIAVLPACKGGEEEKKPEPEPEPTVEKEPEEDKEAEKLAEAKEKAEERASALAVHLYDESFRLAGMFEAAQKPEDPTPTRRKKPKEATGRIDTAALQKVLRQNSSQAQDCYERALKKNPSLAGKVYLTMTIDTDGSVAYANAVGESLMSEQVNNCLERLARDWSFPEPKGGRAKVRAPFTFSPKR